MNTILFDDLELDARARIIKALANEAKSLITEYSGETARWLAISRTNLQNAGMWLGKLRMIAKTSEYPYPESTKPQTGEKIAKAIHEPYELPAFVPGGVEFKDNMSFDYQGVTEWTPVERIKAMRDIIGACIEALKDGTHGNYSNTELMQYAWEGVMLLEHSRHALGMVLGSIRDQRKDITT